MTKATGSRSQAPLRRVVVGTDGSDGGNLALEWAAREAAQRGAALEAYTSYTPGYVFISAQEVQRSMQQVLEDARRRVSALAPEIQFTGISHEGSAAKLLIEASMGADLLVVGSRGLGGFTGLLLGSVSQQCSLHARCPIVIVQPPEEQGTAISG